MSELFLLCSLKDESWVSGGIIWLVLLNESKFTSISHNFTTFAKVFQVCEMGLEKFAWLRVFPNWFLAHQQLNSDKL